MFLLMFSSTFVHRHSDLTHTGVIRRDFGRKTNIKDNQLCPLGLGLCLPELPEYLSRWLLRALQWRHPPMEPFISNMFDISDLILGRLRLSQEQ